MDDFLLSLGFRTWLLFPDFFFSVVRVVEVATVTGFDLAKDTADDSGESCCDCEFVTVETDKLDEFELDEDAISDEAKCEVKLLWAAAAEAATVKGATGATGTKAEGRRV